MKSPQHAIIATVTLALAIGVNTAIFSLVSQVLFIELPMEDPDEVYWVWSRNNETGVDMTGASIADFLDFRERTRSFEDVAAVNQVGMILTGLEQPERITVAQVTANLSDVWGDQPVIGRSFLQGEDRAGADRVVMITHSMWRDRYGSDPGVLGQTLRLDDVEHTIVGVTSPQMETGNLGQARVWAPLEITGDGLNRAVRGMLVTGRLRPGVSFEEAVVEATAIGEALAEEHPETNRGWALDVRTTDDSIMGDEAKAIMTLLVLTVGLVLLIACANVANLVLVRGSARMREFAVRAAMGANRGRLIRQLLTENMLLALAAGALGVGLASLLIKGLVLVTRGQEVLFTIAQIDHRVLLFTLGVSAIAPLFFGLLPALGTVRSDLNDSLRDGVRAGAGRRGGRTRSALVVSQVALALSLMIVSGLLVRSVITMQGVDLGFETEGVLTMVIDLPEARYPTEDAAAFFDELEDRVLTIPAVDAVALASARPNTSFSGGIPFAKEGQEGLPIEQRPTAYSATVSGGYFSVLGIPILQGRTFDERDRSETTPVAVVSREAVTRYWPQGDVIGRRIQISGDPVADWRQIVGVVENVVGGNDLTNPDVPQMYIPASQAPRRTLVFMVRSAAEEAGLTGQVREAVLAIDAQQPIDDVRTMEAYLWDLNSTGFALISMFISFAVFALVMAGMGIYGVMSFMVAQRKQEIGLRMALGAERASVLRLVLRQGGTLLAIGTVIGVVLGVLFGRLTSGLAYMVEATDPLTLIVVPSLLAVIALLANIIPAHRATRIDPMNTLRSD
jgi:predicted permease